MQEPKIDIKEMMMYDWVKVNGVPYQLGSLGARVTIRGEEMPVSVLKPIPIDETDLKIIQKRLKGVKGAAFRYSGEIKHPTIDISYTDERNRMYNVYAPMRYYHELQHAAKAVHLPLNLNYRWREQKEEEEQEGNNE